MIDFGQELAKSGYIHRPLKYVPENSLEEQRRKEKVLECKVRWKGEKVLAGDTETACWSEGMAADGDYAFYGSLTADFKVDRENWETYDRLRFVIQPDCDGVYVPGVTVGIVNDGKEKIPDNYCREGSHVVTLENHEWNDCLWEFGSMPRDEICQVSFSFRRNGREASGGKRIVYRIKEVVLEKTERSLRDHGWECEEGKIAYATTGYFADGEKTAVTAIADDTFYIVSDDTGVAVFTGYPRKVMFDKKTWYLLDFSELTTPGR